MIQNHNNVFPFMSIHRFFTHVCVPTLFSGILILYSCSSVCQRNSMHACNSHNYICIASQRTVRRAHSLHLVWMSKIDNCTFCSVFGIDWSSSIDNKTTGYNKLPKKKNTRNKASIHKLWSWNFGNIHCRIGRHFEYCEVYFI